MSFPAHRKSGFTLTELLTVIAIMALLMGMISGGIVQARRNAKRAKADAELRGLVTAWNQWFQLYGEENDYQWPGDVNGATDLKMNANNLGPVLDATDSDNPKGIVLLNATIEKTAKNPNRDYLDPWGNPYEMTFERSGNLGRPFTVTASIALPNAQMK
ncbi:MAG: type II secretion system protein [Kiritimatiellia bacterium]|jgi:prepilin-type N-terminal cleavage/methylation domain-containing protein